MVITPEEKIRLMYETQKRLRGLKENGERAPPLVAISEKMKTSVDLRFKKGVDPDGNKWAALSIESTLKFNYREGDYPRKGDSPLRDTGRLQRSITPKSGNGFAKVGTNVEYAPTHQFGAAKGSFAQIPTVNGKMRPIPWGNIPARPFFGITNEERKKYNKIILDYIIKGVLQ